MYLYTGCSLTRGTIFDMYRNPKQIRFHCLHFHNELLKNDSLSRYRIIEMYLILEKFLTFLIVTTRFMATFV
jgi:hypothetical protein